MKVRWEWTCWAWFASWYTRHTGAFLSFYHLASLNICVSHFYRFVCWKSIIKMTLLYNSHVQICFDASLSAMIEDDTKSIKLITLLNSVHIFTSSLVFVTHVLVFFSFISSHLTMTTLLINKKYTNIIDIQKLSSKIWTLSSFDTRNIPG